MAATKEQESKALEQIKKIVAGLGEDSYIAKAFEGCFDIAKDNIIYDAAFSMKERLESAEAHEDLLQEKIKKLETKVANLEDELGAARADAEEFRKKAMPEELRGALKAHLMNAIEEKEQHMMSLADIMADLAGSPTDIAFQHAANAYKLERAKSEHYKKMIKKLDELK